MVQQLAAHSLGDQEAENSFSPFMEKLRIFLKILELLKQRGSLYQWEKSRCLSRSGVITGLIGISIIKYHSHPDLYKNPR